MMKVRISTDGMINSRPLTYKSANPCDDVPLTPNHFLYCQSAEKSRRIQEWVRHLRYIWLREWLPNLSDTGNIEIYRSVRWK